MEPEGAGEGEDFDAAGKSSGAGGRFRASLGLYSLLEKRTAEEYSKKERVLAASAQVTKRAGGFWKNLLYFAGLATTLALMRSEIRNTRKKVSHHEDDVPRPGPGPGPGPGPEHGAEGAGGPNTA